jgi:homoserine kinase type II
MLKVFLEGEIFEDLPIHILETIGVEIGKLHQIEPPAYLPKKLNYGIAFFHEVGDYASGTRFDVWLKKIEAYIQPFFSENLPKALIHSDIFFSNIIVSPDGQSAFIMDFEEATHYYRIFDLGMTLVGLCCDGETLNLQKASALLQGYQKEIELQELEKRSLQAFTVYAAAAMTFWRHRNFNHINPNPKMYDHYLGLKVIADSIWKIPADKFKKIID